jgi:hypothetical protein
LRKWPSIAIVLAACSTEEVELPLPPNVFAGFDSFVAVGSPVALDASLSSDPDGDPLSFAWRLEASPEGSTARVENASARVTSIVPDVLGTYVVSLSASDPTQLVSRDLLAFTATASTATLSAIPVVLSPSSQNVLLSDQPVILDVAGGDRFQALLMRSPLGGGDLILSTADRQISFVPPRPGEYWIAASPPVGAIAPSVATVLVVEDTIARPRAVIEAATRAEKNDRVLFDGRGSEGAPTVLRWTLISDPSNGDDALLDLATGCPTGSCRLLLPSRSGTYVVQLEVETGGVIGASAVHVLEVE